MDPQDMQEHGSVGYARGWIRGICKKVDPKMDPRGMQEDGGYAGRLILGICRKMDPRDMQEDRSLEYVGRLIFGI